MYRTTSMCFSSFLTSPLPLHSPKPGSYNFNADPKMAAVRAVNFHLPGIYLFKSIFFLCVHKEWGLTHRPQSWLPTSGRTSVGSETVRNRGATPKCHHSCKTAEYKSLITEICTPRPPYNENRAAFDSAAAAGRSPV